MFYFLIVVILSFAPLLNVRGWPTSSASENNYPLECVVRSYNFPVNVTDDNGKICRGLIRTKICFGSCETSQNGSVIVNPTCNYNESIERTVTLTNCDEGVDPSAITYTYIEAISCSCSKCNPERQQCRTIPNEHALQAISAMTEQSENGTRNSATQRRHARRHERHYRKKVYQ